MTIGELIQILEDHPSDMRVVVNGYEEGYDDLSPEQVTVVKIELNAGTLARQGRHGDPVIGPTDYRIILRSSTRRPSAAYRIDGGPL